MHEPPPPGDARCDARASLSRRDTSTCTHLPNHVTQVQYCSAECQRVHWTKGGHKKECKTMEGPSTATTTTTTTERGGAGGKRSASRRSTPFSRADNSGGGSCIFCLESDPPAIQSGCACRGDAGLAHVECRIMAAEHKQKSTGGTEGWQCCLTCEQAFNGEMAIGLAEEFLRRVEGRSDQRAEWMKAAAALSDALAHAGDFAEAESVCRVAVSEIKRVGGKTVDPVLMGNLCLKMGRAVHNQGKYVEAQAIYERCIADFTKHLGPDDSLTLESAKALGNLLRAQGKHAEAVAIQRDTLERAKRTMGSEDSFTIQCGAALATALVDQGFDRQAQAVFQEHLPVMKRVFGRDHQLTLQTTANYASSLAESGRLAEAETMLVEALEGQRQVLGEGHPSTAHTARTLAIVRSDLKRK
jgi:tetratricopeptide (TPR) repeat protein